MFHVAVVKGIKRTCCWPLWGLTLVAAKLKMSYTKKTLKTHAEEIAALKKIICISTLCEHPANVIFCDLPISTYNSNIMKM